MFSKACQYAIKASIFIATNSLKGNRVTPKEIAQEINSPAAFTAKILQQLVKNNIVKSVRGIKGGFQIEPSKLATIKLSQIVNAIDGDSIYKGCGLGLEECNEQFPCPVHNKFLLIRNNLKLMLENTNLEELAKGINDGASFLKT